MKGYDVEQSLEGLFTEINSVPDMTDVPDKSTILSKTSDTNTPKKKGKPNKSSKTCKTGKSGNKSVLVPKTYKLPLEIVEKIERASYWRREKIQVIVARALSQYLDTVPSEEFKELPKQTL